MTSADERFMRHALALGRRGAGSTWPNPSVGAVVVRETPEGPLVVGTGWTQPGGRPHAEPVALEEAGLAAVGATLYVTLEPCSHRTIRGGTPCVEHTILSGIARVVSAMDDPNPQIAGLGHALLRSSGVRVSTGVLGADAARDLRGHVLRVTQGRPAVTLKLARTADGYAGGAGGRRIAVSCPEASRWVHLERARHDAIMLGIGSVLADDPMLNVRLPGLNHLSPVRVVLDGRLQLDAGLALVRTAGEIPVWVIAAEDAPKDGETALVAAGVEVMRVPRDRAGRIDLTEALRLLALRGITRVYAEGGPSVAEALAEQGLADEIVLSVAPHMLGEEGIPAVRPGLAAAIADAARYRLAEAFAVGQDRFERYERIA